MTDDGSITRTPGTETAVLAGGCFWGMQDLVRKLPGVLRTRVGYSGGDVPNATYRNHGTHAEALEVEFDPTQTSFRDLLEFFFQVHDPSTKNRQGNDIGTQYRSVIFCQDAAQQAAAEQMIARLQADNIYRQPIVTQISAAAPFYPAEAYHQNYFVNHPGQGYCQLVVAPKVSKFRTYFKDWLA